MCDLTTGVYSFVGVAFKPAGTLDDLMCFVWPGSVVPT